MKKIGIIYGGRSTEHDGSVETKKGVIRALDQDIYPVVDSVFIDREGNISLNDVKISHGALVDRIKSNKDVFYFNLMPGNEGEDGSWSGIFDICDGNGSFESVNTMSILMNKYQQCCFALSMLPGMVFCPASALITRDGGPEAVDRVLDGFSSEIIIKPNSMGSSHFMDVFMPYEKARIRELLARLFEYDTAAIVQEFIEGDNYSCGVFGSKGTTRALPVVYQKIEARYMSHAAKFGGPWEKIFPDNPLTKRIQELSVKLADVFDITGMCRFDYVVLGDTIYYLEGNLVPSLATGGSFSCMLEVSGIDFNDFIADMIYSFENRVRNNKVFVYNAE